MGSAILIVLAALILYVALRFFKVTTGNSAYKADETTFLPDGTEGSGDSAEDASEAYDASDTFDASDGSDSSDTSDGGGGSDGGGDQ